MSKQRLKRRVKPVAWHATTQLPQVGVAVAEGVEIDLSDKEPVAGVSYSPSRRLWRAYLHRGKKQVFHAWRETKSEAVAARLGAELRFAQAGGATASGSGVVFERKIKAPGYRDFDRTLKHFALSLAVVYRAQSTVSLFGLKEVLDGETAQRRLGCEIGSLLAMVELLVLDGAVLSKDIEDGMAEKTEKLTRVY